jgi:hypothetical protein
MHNDPSVALVEGPIGEAVKTMTGIPALVVRLSLCLYPYISLSMPSLLHVAPCHSIY